MSVKVTNIVNVDPRYEYTDFNESKMSLHCSENDGTAQVSQKSISSILFTQFEIINYW